MCVISVNYVINQNIPFTHSEAVGISSHLNMSLGVCWLPSTNLCSSVASVGSQADLVCHCSWQHHLNIPMSFVEIERLFPSLLFFFPQKTEKPQQKILEPNHVQNDYMATEDALDLQCQYCWKSGRGRWRPMLLITGSVCIEAAVHWAQFWVLCVVYLILTGLERQ